MSKNALSRNRLLLIVLLSIAVACSMRFMKHLRKQIHHAPTFEQTPKARERVVLEALLQPASYMDWVTISKLNIRHRHSFVSYRRTINYKRRFGPHANRTINTTLWNFSLPSPHTNILVRHISFVAVGQHPLCDPITLLYGGQEYLLHPLKGLEPCFKKRLNFFVHYTASFSAWLPWVQGSFMIFTRQRPLRLIELRVSTSTGEDVVLMEEVELAGDSFLPESCIQPVYPSLKSRTDVLQSLYSHLFVEGFKQILDIPLDKDCVIMTAVLGNYESCLHPVFPPLSTYQRRCMAIAFTDQPLGTLRVHPDWTVIRTPYHLNDIRLQSSSGMSRGKYYKMQVFKLLPTHVRYLLWLDATMELLNASVVDSWIDMLKDASTPLLTAPHVNRPYLLGESCISFSKYMIDYPNIVSEYLDAVKDGFCEQYWKNDSKPMNVRDLAVVSASAFCEDPSTNLDSLQWGYEIAKTALGALPTCKKQAQNPHSPKSNVERHSVYVTCVLLLDLYSSPLRNFLDYWYESTMRHQQDQVPFSIGLWRYGLTPGTIGFDPQRPNRVVKKHDHGVKGCPGFSKNIST